MYKCKYLFLTQILLPFSSALQYTATVCSSMTCGDTPTDYSVFTSCVYHTELINALTAFNAHYHSIFFLWTQSFWWVAFAVILKGRNSHIPDNRLPSHLKFVLRCTGAQESSLLWESPFWHREFWGGSWIFGVAASIVYLPRPVPIPTQPLA